MPSKIISKELEDEIINFYRLKPITLAEVAKQFSLSNPTIGRILKDTPKYKKAKIFNPEMDERFFENINEETKAYFLGLIISDGNVFYGPNGRQASISITLDLNDEYLLQVFKDAVKTNTAIAYDGRGCGQIAVRSDLMAGDLAKYGVVPRKSFETYLPKIGDEMMPHLVRGIMDGDGSVLAKQSGTKFLHCISFCGTHRLMDDLSKYLYDNLKLTQRPTVYDYKDRYLSELKIQNYLDILTFVKWVYKDATVYMSRKRKKALEIVEHGNAEVTNRIARGRLEP